MKSKRGCAHGLHSAREANPETVCTCRFPESFAKNQVPSTPDGDHAGSDKANMNLHKKREITAKEPNTTRVGADSENWRRGTLWSKGCFSS